MKKILYVALLVNVVGTFTLPTEAAIMGFADTFSDGQGIPFDYEPSPPNVIRFTQETDIADNGTLDDEDDGYALLRRLSLGGGGDVPSGAPVVRRSLGLVEASNVGDVLDISASFFNASDEDGQIIFSIGTNATATERSFELLRTGASGGGEPISFITAETLITHTVASSDVGSMLVLSIGYRDSSSLPPPDTGIDFLEVTVTPVPEPASLLLVGIGAPFLMVRSRQNRVTPK